MRTPGGPLNTRVDRIIRWGLSLGLCAAGVVGTHLWLRWPDVTTVGAANPASAAVVARAHAEGVAVHAATVTDGRRRQRRHTGGGGERTGGVEGGLQGVATGLNGLEDVITQKVVSGVLLNEIDEDARIKEDMTVPS